MRLEQTQNEAYLRHHGIKGMRWGIRRTPDQLGRKEGEGSTDSGGGRTLPKGTIMFRTTANAKESTSGSKYVTYLQEDRDHYRGQWASSIRANAGKGAKAKLYENTYELKADLKIPSESEVAKTLKTIMKNPEIRKEAFQSYVNQLKTNGSLDGLVDWGKVYDWADYNQKVDVEAKKMVGDMLKTYGKMSPESHFSITTKSIGTAPALKDAIVKELSRKGYNAMDDYASIGGTLGYMKEGRAPLIVFEGSSSLQTKKTSTISKRTERKATKNYIDFLERVNRR